MQEYDYPIHPVTQQQDTIWDAMAHEMCFQNEEDMLRTFYETFSIAEMAQKLRCGTTTIQRRMAKYKIKTRGRGGSNVGTDQRYKLFHIDQRRVVYIGTNLLAGQINVGHSLLYKYKCWKTNKRQVS